VPETPSKRHVYFNGFNRQFGENVAGKFKKVDYEGYRFRVENKVKIDSYLEKLEMIWEDTN
jgi:hypothetical protein